MPTGYSVQDMAIALDDVQNSVAALHAETHGFRTEMGNIQASLQSMVHMLSKEYLLDDLISPATLNTNDVRLDRKGRRFLSIFSPVPVAAVTANVMGIKGFTFTLAAGWNPINLPDGTVLNGATGTNQSIVIKCTNFVQPPAALTPVGAAVALASGAPTATSVATDTPISFANAVQHLVIQNNSGQNVYYAFDAVASTGSFVLTPNAQAFFDWPVLTLHLYTATAVNINAATGIVLAGRA
jgi:hypothetical protein